MVAALVQVGTTLGLSVIADGIQTELETAILVECGCQYGQGELLALPNSPRSEAVDDCERTARPRRRGEASRAVTPPGTNDPLCRSTSRSHSTVRPAPRSADSEPRALRHRGQVRRATSSSPTTRCRRVHCCIAPSRRRVDAPSSCACSRGRRCETVRTRLGARADRAVSTFASARRRPRAQRVPRRPHRPAPGSIRSPDCRTGTCSWSAQAALESGSTNAGVDRRRPLPALRHRAGSTRR